MELQAETGSAAKALSVVLRDATAVQRYYMPNIKGGGVLVETPNLLPIGTEVLLMISLPDSQPRVPIVGKVVWVTPPDNRDGRPPAIGVQFVNDRSGVLIRIQNALSGLPENSGEVLSF
ncbi:Type IV pilus assembly PilZ [Acidithiobacillus ferrivorans]|uniref:Type IV pilus assembly PilZ n=1 Tax=Acidithiobacillus ferrivorans TaxID=160808 RepID=A0A060UN81_9PROT|nr:PilZ domain-containing protein [Acidithiobacillus ferrivorans]CDQ10087.1 Type IV pilus assembly PilZ [Acidithiobacillus ferrivorans]SMH64049.1 Type IV pilus assembly PilZ [Acidithiobacillus ferrivorans]